MARLKRAITSTLLLLVLFILSSIAHADETLTFGVVPQQAASKLARLWSPILSHVSQQSGVTIVFRTAPNIPEFEKRVLAGEYDIAYMNPYHYTVFHEEPGYIAIAKQQGKRIRGIIVTRKDSPIQDLSELENLTLAYPAPAAFAASVLPRAALKERSIPMNPRYVSSHDSVYRAVAKGLYPAGGGIERTLANADQATRAELKVLWRTPGYTPHAIAVHPRIAESTRQAIQAALSEMSETAVGQKLLASIKFKGIEPANDEDWNDVRGLGLTELSGLKH